MLNNQTQMGCTSSVYAIGKKKKKIIPEVSVFFPVLRIPMPLDLQMILKGLVPKDLAARISSIRNQIVLVAENTGLILESLILVLSCFLNCFD